MPRNNVLSPFPASRHVHARCLKTALTRAEAACQARGRRLTHLRRRVLELVWNSHEPVKAYDILRRLRAEHRGAAPPTVYRALDFLKAQGLVHKIESLNAYFGCGAPGHVNGGQFLICHGCGEVAEIGDAEISMLIADRAQRLGFACDRQTIEVDGLCGECRAGR